MFSMCRKQPPPNEQAILRKMQGYLKAIIASNDPSGSAQSSLLTLAFKNGTDNHIIPDAGNNRVTLIHEASAYGVWPFELKNFEYGSGPGSPFVKPFDVQDSLGFTPAFYAALNGHMSVLRGLLKLLHASKARCFLGCPTTETLREALYYRLYVIFSCVKSHADSIDQLFPAEVLYSYEDLIDHIERLQKQYHIPTYLGFPSQEVVGDFKRFVEIFRSETAKFYHSSEPTYFQRATPASCPVTVLKKISSTASNAEIFLRLSTDSSAASASLPSSAKSSPGSLVRHSVV